MKLTINSPLQQVCPELPFAQDADEWLDSILPTTSIFDQLFDRRISMICFISMISTGGLGIGIDGKFFIALNNHVPQNVYADTLGHEIGHTFHFNDGTPPKKTLPNPLRPRTEITYIFFIQPARHLGSKKCLA